MSVQVFDVENIWMQSFTVLTTRIATSARKPIIIRYLIIHDLKLGQQFHLLRR